MINQEHTEQRIQGLLLAQKISQALDLSLQWLESAPDDPQAWFCNAVCLHVSEDIDAALAAFEQVLKRNPGHIQALNGRGGMLARKGDFTAALAVFRDALSRSGNDPDLRLNEALALEALERLPEALECYDATLVLHSDHISTLMNRGLLLARMQRFDEATRQGEIVAEKYPDVVMAHINFAEILLRASHYQKSLDTCEYVLKLDADNIAAQVIMTIGLAALGRLREANTTLSLARADPITADSCCLNLFGPQSPGIQDLVPGEVWFQTAWARFRNLDWTRYDEDIALARRLFSSGDEGIPILVGHEFYLPLQTLYLDDSIRRQHAIGLSKQLQQGLQPQVFLARVRASEDRLRIAYLIADWEEDSILRLFAPLLSEHSRDQFLVNVYSLGQCEGGELLDRYRQWSDHFVDISDLSDREAAFRIYQDSNDILVELSPYDARTRNSVSAYKPVPIQLWYAGHSGTSGSPWMDYALVDKHTSPLEDRPYWTEQRALLPVPAIALSKDDCVTTATSRQALHLPKDQFVFCSFNRPEQIEPLMFGAWMRVLLRVPDSVLWLHASSHAAIRGLVAEADYRGIHSQRLLFTLHEPNRKRHLENLAAADLYLDTFVDNGYSNVSDAILAGVAPLVCQGQYICGRRSAALMKGLGLDVLVSPDLEAYENMAVDLATHPQQLENIRRTLFAETQNSQIFNARQQAQDLETAYTQIWTQHRDQQTIEEFVV